MEQELSCLLQSYELQGKQPFVSDFSRLLQHVIKKGRGRTLYNQKKPWGPTGTIEQEMWPLGRPQGIYLFDLQALFMTLFVPKIQTHLRFNLDQHFDQFLFNWVMNVVSRVPARYFFNLTY